MSDFRLLAVGIELGRAHGEVWSEPQNCDRKLRTKYIEWSEEWICPELFTLAI